VGTPIELERWEYELMLELGQALTSSLELRVALDRAVPILEKLVGTDHVALAISRPGNLHDYEWYNTTLPERFLGEYPSFADQDFVRRAVARVPNQVLRDEQMIARRKLQRHVVYDRARQTGAKLEHVLAVMLCYEREWSSGLSLYRSRAQPFDERDAALVQLVVPQLRHAVNNARQHAALRREQFLEPAVAGLGLAILWIDGSFRELARTARATAFLEQYFPPAERRSNALPRVLVDPLRRYLESAVPNKMPPVCHVDAPSSRLQVSYVPLPEQVWALVFRARGLSPELQSKLSPRLIEIADSVLRGMSNEAIARRDGRSLATIKQQVSEVYARLGVRGRKGLIQMTWGEVE
jgi:DNA-binding CsgD family transcriptional regulator/GAF domain-containing protein